MGYSVLYNRDRLKKKNSIINLLIYPISKYSGFYGSRMEVEMK